MKNLKSALCLVLVLSCILCLAACGGSSVAGKYELVSMEANGETVKIEDLKEYMGDIEMYLELKADGTGVLNMMGETVDMKYADGQIWAVDEEDEKVPFTVKGNTLTMEQDGQVLVFEK